MILLCINLFIDYKVIILAHANINHLPRFMSTIHMYWMSAIMFSSCPFHSFCQGWTK